MAQNVTQYCHVYKSQTTSGPPVVSINFSLEKDSVVFSAYVNYNIVLFIEFSSLRLKCDMGEVFFSIAL